MKLIFALSLFCSAAQSSSLTTLATDQASYVVNNKAILLSYQNSLPVNPEYEHHTELRVAGSEVIAVRLSPKLVVGVSPRFLEGQPVLVESITSLQEKREALTLAQGIARYKAEKRRILAALETETDPAFRASLQKQLTATERLLNDLYLLQSQSRSLVEIQAKMVPVAVVSKAVSSIFTLTADRNPAEYAVGERAVFTADLQTEFTGPDGPKENVFRGRIGTTPILPAKTGNLYFFTSPYFTTAGAFPFAVDLFVRSQKQADLLRSTAALARAEKTKLEKERDSAIGEEYRIYLAGKIQDFTTIISALQSQLEESLLLVQSSTLPITVSE